MPARRGITKERRWGLLSLVGDKRTVLVFLFMFGFAYFSISGIRGYMIAFLEYLSYSPATIGALASVMAAAGIVGQFTIGYLCDKKGCLKPFFYLTMTIVVVSSFVIFAIVPPVGMLFVFFAIVGSSHGTCLALSDSWVMESRDGLRGYYGAVRGAGSIGWSLGLLIYGLTVAAFGFASIPILAVFTAIIAYILGRGLPDVQKTSSKVVTLSTLKELGKNFKYVYLVVTVLLAFTVIQADWVLNSMKAAQLGTPASIGIFMFVQTSSEVPFFFIFRRLQRRFDVSKIFAFGVFVYLVRIGMMRAAPDIWTMTLVAITNSICFAPAHISSRLMFDRQCPDHLKTAGQLIANAICAGLGGIIAPLAFGHIVGAVGLDYSAYILMAFSTIPLVMALIYIKLQNKPIGGGGSAQTSHT